MTTDPLHPPIEPYDHGMLDVGDGHHVYWEACGNPTGKPALFVHGGPGWGAMPERRRVFDPATYRAVLFDQRGCGRSTPHASDPTVDMGLNTTDHLIADMERLREHLGVDRWLLYGGSWGSTLILAYAQRHPHRVSEIIIAAVTTGRRSETDWLYRGIGRVFPAEFARFRAGVPESERDGDLTAAYARLMEHPDPEVRMRAADAWCTWEDELLSAEPGGSESVFRGLPPANRLALVRICSHYFSNGAWLDEGVLLRDAGRLAGIPGVLVHGRQDLTCPLESAWLLAEAWPDAELTVIDDAGHLGSTAMRTRVRTALDTFAGR